MRKEIWDDDLSMISPRYDQKYWLLNNDPAVTLNNRQISVAPQRISVTPQFWSGTQKISCEVNMFLCTSVQVGCWRQGQAWELGSPPLRMALTWKTCQTAISFHQNPHCNRWLAGTKTYRSRILVGGSYGGRMDGLDLWSEVTAFPDPT